MFETTVHNTLRDDDNPDWIEDHGPFPVKNWQAAYLGKGYYFWDDHLELAHYWGENYIKGPYVICEGAFQVERSELLDLVGSRQHQKLFHSYIDKFKELKGKNVGEIIEFLKDYNRKPNFKGLFPFTAIRAIDWNNETAFEGSWFNFAEGKGGETDLAPKMIICLIEKSSVILQSFKIIYPEEYVQE